MALEKNPKFNLRGKYERILEISLIISLTFLIAAFKFFPPIDKNIFSGAEVDNIINIVDIQPTLQDARPPVPPRPFQDFIIDEDPLLPDIDILPTDLDPDAKVVLGIPDNNKGRKVIEEEPFYYFAEEMPQPVGGIQAIHSRINYPEIARNLGIEGKVYVLAYVNENGDVVKAEIVKGIGAGLDKEAQKAVEATKFSPGKQRGVPVKVKITIPIVFRLR
jgi:periplasmic protein TonB